MKRYLSQQLCYKYNMTRKECPSSSSSFFFFSSSSYSSAASSSCSSFSSPSSSSSSSSSHLPLPFTSPPDHFKLFPQVGHRYCKMTNDSYSVCINFHEHFSDLTNHGLDLHCILQIGGANVLMTPAFIHHH